MCGKAVVTVEEQTARDVQGNMIFPGDLVAYPDRKGASLWMNTARVLEILTHPVSGRVTGLRVESTSHKYGQRIKHALASIVTRLDRVVII